MRYKYTNLKIGSVLSRIKIGVVHKGVYLGNGMVIHTSPGLGVCVVTLESFAMGHQIKIDNSTSVDESTLNERVDKVLNENCGYSILGNNCQHLVNYLLKGIKESPQLQIATISALTGAAISSGYGGSKMKGAIVGGVLGALLYTALNG